MEDFAKCAGLYDALAEHFIKFDAMEDVSENMTGMSNGAEVTAMYFWSNYSDNPVSYTHLTLPTIYSV